MFGFADSLNKLYYIKSVTKAQAKFWMTNDRVNLHHLWYEKLRHLNYTSMAKLLDLTISVNLLTTIFSKKTCGYCIESHHRQNRNLKKKPIQPNSEKWFTQICKNQFLQLYTGNNTILYSKIIILMHSGFILLSQRKKSLPSSGYFVYKQKMDLPVNWKFYKLMRTKSILVQSFKMN